MFIHSNFKIAALSYSRMLPPRACTPPASSCPLAAILNGPIRRNQNHWMSPWLIAVLPFEQHTGQYMIIYDPCCSDTFQVDHLAFDP